MKFQVLPTLLLAGAISATPIAARSAVPSNLPFNFTYAFTAVLQLGAPVPPVTIPGGILIAEPIKSGRVTGPAVNATILGGIAHPSLYDNKTLQVPSIDFYGVTDDGTSFFGHDGGVGSNAAQINRVVSQVFLCGFGED